MFRNVVRRATQQVFTSAHHPPTAQHGNLLKQHAPRGLMTSSSATPPSGPSDGSSRSSPTSAAPTNEDDLFNEENLKDIHPSDVEKLRATFKLVKEHVDAVEKGIEEVDPATNPLLDPRSFEMRRLPKLSNEILSHFQSELPPEVAEFSKPVNTREIWDSMSSGRAEELLAESATPGLEWERIDHLTMTKQSLSKRGRTNTNTANATPTPPVVRPMAPQTAKKKKPIKLRNKEGKIEVDFRAVSTLNMFITETGKIMPRRKTKLSAKSQKLVSKAIKRARCMALIDPAPTGPTMAELAALHTPEELDVRPIKIDSFSTKKK